MAYTGDMKQVETKKENNLAIAALVLGIVSFAGPGPLTGIPAIILGTLSLKNPTNRGLGIAGIILGSLSVILALLLILFVLFVILISTTSNSYDYIHPMPMYDHYESSSATQQSI
ncbi:hypothetical protein RAAC3_TM7C00001G0340 [Candidatus Saccharibacteria bacterium RAAC3_TM7_1]|nr:hypothetical protein RAAC3_TM7C00001G0340 [Candidatus Saccharibacteria bacterium RAAC3_TM7_1]